MGSPEPEDLRKLFKNTPQTPAGVETFLGPFRPIRAGEGIDEKDVFTQEGGLRVIPERKYGGRRNHGGPLPEGVPVGRRHPQDFPHEPQTQDSTDEPQTPNE